MIRQQRNRQQKLRRVSIRQTERIHTVRVMYMDRESTQAMISDRKQQIRGKQRRQRNHRMAN